MKSNSTIQIQRNDSILNQIGVKLANKLKINGVLPVHIIPFHTSKIKSLKLSKNGKKSLRKYANKSKIIALNNNDSIDLNHLKYIKYPKDDYYQSLCKAYYYAIISEDIYCFIYNNTYVMVVIGDDLYKEFKQQKINDTSIFEIYENDDTLILNHYFHKVHQKFSNHYKKHITYNDKECNNTLDSPMAYISNDKMSKIADFFKFLNLNPKYNYSFDLVLLNSKKINNYEKDIYYLLNPNEIYSENSMDFDVAQRELEHKNKEIRNSVLKSSLKPTDKTINFKSYHSWDVSVLVGTLINDVSISAKTILEHVLLQVEMQRKWLIAFEFHKILTRKKTCGFLIPMYTQQYHYFYTHLYRMSDPNFSVRIKNIRNKLISTSRISELLRDIQSSLKAKQNKLVTKTAIFALVFQILAIIIPYIIKAVFKFCC